jgi:hypothetical protein
MFRYKAPPYGRMMYCQISFMACGNKKMRVIALFLLCMFSETAIAQTSECQSIPKASARLACYDKMSPPIAPGKSATLKTPPPEQGKNVDPFSAENARTDAATKNICRGR